MRLIDAKAIAAVIFLGCMIVITIAQGVQAGWW